MLAPPSLHVSGRTYDWRDGYGLDDLPLAPLPAWVLERLSEARDRLRFTEDSGPIGEGQRNDTLFRLGCRLRTASLTVHETEAALLAVNQRRCQPALKADEVEEIGASCTRYSRGARLILRRGGVEVTL